MANVIHMPTASRDTDLMSEVGLRLARTRDALGWTQQQMADAINVGRTTVDNWEQGIRLADVVAILRLKRATGVPLEWIFAGDITKVPHEIAIRLLGDQKGPLVARRY